MPSTAEQLLAHITGKNKPLPAPEGMRPSKQRDQTEKAMRELLERQESPRRRVPVEADAGGD